MRISRQFRRALESELRRLMEGMRWRGVQRGKPYATSVDDELDYWVIPKRNGKFYIDARLAGGAKHSGVPRQDFDTIEDAMAWVEQHEQKRLASRSRRQDKPIRF